MKHRLEKKLKSKGVAKVPVIMQMESAECGAASLAMIMAYFGKWVSLEEVRTRCDVSADGAKPSNIVRAGQGLGLDGHAYRYELGALKTKGKFPCIAFVEFSHFIVLKGIRGNRIYINDPGRGNYSMTMDSFDKIFTGLILSFEPNKNFVADGQRMSVISFIKDNVKGSYAAMVMLSIATALISVIGLIRPEIDREFIDNVLVRDDFEWEMIFLLILLSISFCNVIMEIVRSVVAYRLSGKLDIVGESSLLWSVLNKPLRFFSQRMIGDIQQRQESNSEISDTIVNTFVPMLINSCMAVFYLVVILNYNVVLGCIGLFATIAKLVIARIISKIKINITRQRLRNHGKLVGITVTGIDMIETIKSSGAESGFLNRWTGYHSLVNESNIKYSTINVYLGTIPTIITIVSNIVILALGCGLIMDGHLTLGAFMAINSLIASFADPAGMLITSGQTIQEMRTQMERIKDVFDYPEDEIFKDETEASDLPIKKLEGDIELKNVSFGYTKLGPKTIEDINISVKKGQQIAIVGGSGCGKSTVAKIMTGLLRPDEGEVFFDGRKLNEITHREFVASVASVDQECFLFDDTIENNIRIWNQEIENSDIVKAAKDAQIHEEIIRNFGNYSYKIKESGKNISGGQKQRIEIARVLASNPSIILLDEATNALDSKTEYEVMKAIKQREATCIIIAHRLSTIRDCDTIYVMDKGKIVEQGTHDKLYEANGIYKALITNE